MEASDYYSVFVGAYCLNNNRALQNLDTSLIPNSSISAILEVAKELDLDTDRIPRGILLASLNPGYNYAVDNLYQYIHEKIDNSSPESLKEDYIAIKGKLKELKKRKDFAGHLRMLADMSEAGDMNKVNQILWGLRYDEPVNVETTLSYMIDSLNEISGFKTGIKQIDNNTGGLNRGNLMSISGDSGHFKTMVSTWMMLNILKENPTFHGVYFEKEMPIKDLAIRLVSYFMKTDQKEIKEMTDDERSDYGNRLIESISSNKELISLLDRLHIIPNTAFDTASDMVDYVKYFNANIWCLDFMTMLGEGASEEDNYYAYLKREMDILKMLAVKTNSLGIILGQLKQQSVDARKNKIPLRQDIEYGSKLKQYAAYMFSTFYPGAYYTEAIVSDRYYYLIGIKNRHSKPFDIPLIARPTESNFEEPDIADINNMNRWLKDYKENNATGY